MVWARVLGTYEGVLVAITLVRAVLEGVLFGTADFNGETKGLLRALEALLSLRRFAVSGEAMIHRAC